MLDFVFWLKVDCWLCAVESKRPPKEKNHKIIFPANLWNILANRTMKKVYFLFFTLKKKKKYVANPSMRFFSRTYLFPLSIGRIEEESVFHESPLFFIRHDIAAQNVV